MMKPLSVPGPGWLIVLLLMFASLACAHSQKTPRDEQQTASDGNRNRDASVIHSDQIARTSEDTIEEILRGRVAGVVVLPSPDGGFRLRIRGSQTFAASNEPLIVIDGVPLSNSYQGTIPVNPHDVESIRVLKKASDKAFYGIRGANGIIVITTKRGS